ncbi:MAG: NAD(P)-dependent alcohol dehydrogenase [Chloroflexi bacterium]|nr:NAD(P)-dependent alcohol dehydrogenase [Chloroflexota bacterium]
MKAVVFHSYGMDVLKIEEVEKPTPKENEVLVKVCATSVNPAEWYGMSGMFLARLGNGLFKPKDNRLGADFAGIVEAVGRDVTDFKPGDEVFGGRSGAYTEYVCVQKGIARKPANITFEQAGSVAIAGLTALQGLRDHGNLQPGQKVLINGASGGVGTFAVQIAKALGAEVTAVCSTKNVEMVRSLGADLVIDYTKEDFTRTRQRYDLFLDVAGSRSWIECRRILTPKATVVIIGGPKGKVIGPLKHIIPMRLFSMRASQKVVFFIANFNREDMEVMRKLMESGKVKPVIDRIYPLNQINEAMSYLGTGHAKAKIAVTIQ